MMPSNIDPTKPAQDVPASKADLRANLQAAKTELDHGGFAEGFSPTNYTPSPADTRLTSHLAGLDAVVGVLQTASKAGIITNAGTAISVNLAAFGNRELVTILCTAATAVVATLANDVPEGRTVELVRKGAGNVTGAPGAGATLAPIAGSSSWPSALHSTTDLNEALVYKVDSNTTGTNASWRLVARP
jgi:hypothetical protein